MEAANKHKMQEHQAEMVLAVQVEQVDQAIMVLEAREDLVVDHLAIDFLFKIYPKYMAKDSGEKCARREENESGIRWLI